MEGGKQTNLENKRNIQQNIKMPVLHIHTHTDVHFISM